jgi:hypothetical protein
VDDVAVTASVGLVSELPDIYIYIYTEIVTSFAILRLASDMLITGVD